MFIAQLQCHEVSTTRYRGCVKNQRAYGNLQVRKADPVPASCLKGIQQKLGD